MLDRHRCTFPVHHRLHLKDGPTLGAVRIWAGLGQTDLGAGFQALAANVAQAARHCFALAVAMRRSEQPCLAPARSEAHTSELQSLMRLSYSLFCLRKHN